MTDADVVIVGAGLAGLSCAQEVARHGLVPVVLEASDGVGGRVRTDLVDGYRLDRGFQILLTAYPEVVGQLDVDALQLQRFDPGAIVWNGSSMEPVSDPLRRPGQLGASLRADVGSLGDKVRVGLLSRRLAWTDPAKLLRRADRTTADALAQAGISDRMVRSFFRPLLGGIQLDLELGTSARMFDVIFRTLAIGDAAVPATGMQAIPNQLAAGLPPSAVRLSTAVASLDGTSALLAEGGRVSGRAIVVATEGPVASSLTGLPDPGSKSVSALWFTTAEPPVRGRSIVLDGVGSGPVANLAVMSQVARTYAPAGRSLVVAACPGDLGDDLEARVRTQLRGWFGSAVGEWELLRVDRIAHGQPLALPGFSPKRRVSLGDGRFVAGDHHDTPSIQGAMFSGRRCGAAVAASLTG